MKFSTDPELEAKVRDVVGLYLDPPDKAIVLCIDEKGQIQALDRIQPMLPVCQGLAARRTEPPTNPGRFTAWLERNKRATLHFTPTSGSCLNLVEVFFSIITRQAIVRGIYTSVPDLVDAIRRFIDAYNVRCEPFVWTKPADAILDHCKSKATSATAH